MVDPALAARASVGPLRMNFLLAALRDLDGALRARGSRLLVLHGDPATVLMPFLQACGATVLTYEVDTEPYARARDAAVARAASAMGIATVTADSHTLFPVASYAPGLTAAFSSFCKRFSARGPVPVCAPDPPAVFPPLPAGVAALDRGIPSLAELGAPLQADQRVVFPGGETEALARLATAVVARSAWVANFQKPDTAPNALEPATTVLSPYLKFGCLSVRRFYHAVDAIYREHPRHSQPPVSLHACVKYSIAFASVATNYLSGEYRQLLWREFYYAHSWKTPNYDRMLGNPNCKQIPWDTNSDLLAAWKEARTGG